jgi:hypothetical protein
MKQVVLMPGLLNELHMPMNWKRIGYENVMKPKQSANAKPVWPP